MIRTIAPIAFAVVLTACASPGFLGERSQVVTEAGSSFRVYMRSGTGMVQAHRISPELLPSKSLVLVKAGRAIEYATGCGMVPGSVEGDQAIASCPELVAARLLK